MDIQKDGYVGYGTTNPQTIIHIVQSNVTITLEDPRNDINSTANIEFKNGSGDQNSDWKLSSSNSFFNIASVSNNTCNILSLNSNGNIIVAKDIVIGGNIVKNGENIDISKIHTSNITSGALLVERGGTGLNILQPNQLIVGNGINPPIQSSNLFWNNTTNTLTTSNINALTFSGIGSNITRINANNIETGTINTLRLPVATTNTIGAIKKGDNINIAEDGTISVNLAYYNGPSTINGDFVVNSNLIVHGTSTTLNTDVYTTEILELTYGGTANTTFTIKQTAVGNTNNILNVTNSSTSNVFNVSSGGNVGIGITNPTSKLHIMTIDTAATTTNLLDFRNAGNYGIYATSIPIGSRGNTLDFLARDYNNASTLHIRNILSLRPEGNVGIGITNPSELLHVNGIIKSEGTIISGTDILSSNHIYTTSSTGRLGIGINPNMPTSSHIHLHRNSANTEIKLQFTDGTTLSTATNGLALYKGSDQNGYLWNYENNALILGTYNIERLRILNNGNIGIGTNTGITERLVVSGNAQISGTISGNGSLITNINAGNITTGTLPVGHGGIGSTTLTATQVLVGDGANPITSFSGLTWTNGTNTLTATNITGAGSNITNINANNISDGTIDRLRLPFATSTGDVGAVKKGNNINIDGGTISVDLATYNGPSTINGDLVVNSNLIVHGTSTTLNTDVYTTETLEVTNSGSINSTLTIKQTSVGNTNNILNVTNSSTSNVFNVSSSGNVGIGTTLNTAGVLLDVNGIIESRTSVGANNTFYFKGVANSDLSRVTIAGQYSTGSAVNDTILRSNNKLVLQSGVGAASIIIDTANNVGIGITNPQTTLDVNGNLLIRAFGNSGSGTKGIFFRPDFVTANLYNCSILTFDHNLNGSSDGLSINANDGVSFCSGSNARNERMRISENGNVGIGTINPQRPLHVQSAMRIGGSGPVIDFGDNMNVQIYRPFTNNELSFTTSGIDRFRITDNGLYFQNNVWHSCLNSNARFNFASNATTYIRGHGNTPISFRNGADTTILNISDNGILDVYSNINIPLGSKYKINGQDLAFNNLIGIIPSSNLPFAGTGITGALGGVKVDGSSISIDSNGIISALLSSGSKWILLGSDNIYKLSGNVGIGIDSNIDEKLIVNGNLKIINGSLLTSNIITSNIITSNIITSNITTNIVNAITISGAGSNITNINADNISSGTIERLRLPLATSVGAVGAVKVDGSSITIDSNGRISASSASGSKWTLLDSDNIYKLSGNVGIGIYYNIDEKLIVNGNIKIMNGSLLTSNIITSNITTNIVNAQTISGAGSNITNINANNISDGTIDSLRLPLASSSVLGAVKKGNNINIAGDGTISVDLATYNGDSTINGDLVVNSNLIIHGTSTTLNTEVYTTEILEITNGGANSTLTIKQTASGNTSNILNVINSSTANVFNISSTGNVGIGTSTNTNNVLLDVNGNIESRMAIGTNNSFYFRGVANSDLSIVTIAGQLSTGSAVNDTILRSTNKLALQSGTGAPAIVIDTANNVGIGTTNPNPNYKLHVNDGNVYAGNGSYLLSTFNATGARQFFGKQYYDTILGGMEIENTTLGGNYSQKLHFHTHTYGDSFGGGSFGRRMTIAENGDVGIGTTNPRYNLQIEGTNPILSIIGQGGSGAKSQINLSTYDEGVNAPSCSIIATDGGNFSSTFQINLKTPNSITNSQFTPFFINSSGNVGIGITTSINNKLEVNGNINIPLGSTYKIDGSDLAFSNLIGIVPPASLPIAGTGVSGLLGAVKVDGSSITIDSNGRISSTSSAGSKWNLSGTDNIYKVSGNVGIGIDSNIDEKLIVNGNLKITNGSLLTSNIITSNIITSNITTNILNAQTISGVGSNITLINANNISEGTIDSLRLPLATSAGAVGAVKKGNNINIAGDGTISVDLASYTGNSTINGDLVVNSNLIVYGTSTTLNTDVYTTEILDLTYNGTTNSTLTVRQTNVGNTNSILNVIGSATTTVFNISSTGAVSTNNNNIGVGSGSVTAATFIGALTGNAATATIATTAITANNLSNAANITSGTINSDRLPLATSAGAVGAVKKGNNINIDANGTISVDLATYTGSISVGSGTVTAATFTGALSGNAATATNASGLTGNPNITVGTISCSSITGSGQLNQITNTTDGEVKIGVRNNSTGTSAYTLMSVENAAGSSCGIFLNSSTRTTDGGVNTATLRNDAGDLRLAAASSSPFIYLKSSNGNVGIGTTNPTTAKLVISGTAGLTGLDMATNDQYAEMRVIRNSLSTIDKDLYLNYNAGANSKTRIYSNNVETILVSEGNVGIGKTPSYKLDVNGDVNATNIRIGGISLDTTFIRADAVTSNFWKNVKSTLNNSIYYGAPVKIGGNNTIDVGNNYILEVLGNVRIKGTITQGWIGDGSTSGDGGILAPTIFGSGSEITNLNANNITLGTLPVTRGGIGTTALTATQLLVGDGTNPVTSFAGLTWVSGTNTLVTTNITNSGNWSWAPNTNYLLNATANTQDWSFDLMNQNTYTGCIWQVSSDKTGLGSILACRGDTGFVGIGTNPSAYRLTVQGDIAASEAIISYYSDERLKDIKEYVKDVLPVLSKINVFKYNCNDLAASYGFDKSKNEIGLSAQEIKKYYPELVALAPFDTIRNEGSDINISKSGEDYLTLKYERLVPVLLQGIKELKQENNLQQKEINDLKLRLTRLELLL